MIQDIPIGSLLIQSEDSTGEPLLLHLMLPTCIRQRHLAARSFVFLLDAQIGTGAAAFMAIRVLLEESRGLVAVDGTDSVGVTPLMCECLRPRLRGLRCADVGIQIPPAMAPLRLHLS